MFDYIWLLLPVMLQRRRHRHYHTYILVVIVGVERRHGVESAKEEACAKMPN